MLPDRASGILLHPTSLPSPGGIGDLGPAAYEFADFLAGSHQSLWQVLPLSPPGYGYSPYSATSAFAGNPLLVSLDRLAERGWIARDRIPHELTSGNVDFETVTRRKMPLLEEAARNFLAKGNGEHARYRAFLDENSGWLEDFVLFDALRTRYDLASWNEWPRPIALRDPVALETARKELSAECEIRRVIQFAFYEQWRALHSYCAQRGIRIVGDVAIFISFDSADVWTHPDIFYLDQDRNPTVVAGVPPDGFSADGQRWGNPLYRWDVLEGRGYDWWIQRMKSAVTVCDYLRLDHFRGFQQYWEIQVHEPTARHGRWVDGPKEALFHALRKALGDLPFIAEDLGLITEDVVQLRERLKIPGMKVLQFGFGDRGAHMYLPHKYERNFVVYTGTHDNDTTLGWWERTAAPHEKEAARRYLGEPSDGMHWAFIRAALNSVADFCVVPLQDVLGLGNEARMNVPSASQGNWAWRYPPGSLTAELREKLGRLTELADRDQPQLSARQQRQREVAEEFAA